MIAEYFSHTHHILLIISIPAAVGESVVLSMFFTLELVDIYTHSKTISESWGGVFCLPHRCLITRIWNKQGVFFPFLSPVFSNYLGPFGIAGHKMFVLLRHSTVGKQDSPISTFFYLMSLSNDIETDCLINVRK